jgi:hypothetical protein
MIGISENPTGLRVTVWRAYLPTRQIVIQEAGSESPRYLGSDDDLQRDVFTWQAREDVWGGLTDETTRQMLSQRFREDFDPFLPPDKRDFSKLAAFLAELQTAAQSPQSSWATSAQQIGDDDADPSMRLNPLLAFYNQLLWIYEVFRELPGASITVR